MLVNRHLFKRTETRNGKKEVHWYFWFYDENGKQVKKSCGKNGKPCYLKRDAEAFIAELEEQDKRQAEEQRQLRQIRLRDVGETLYDNNSYFIKIKAARGKTYLPQTIHQKKALMNLVLNEFGDRIPETIEEGELENFIISLDYANSYKNTILCVIRELFGECKRLNLVKHKLDIDGFRCSSSRKKDILTMEQLSMMFPADIDALTEIWKSDRRDRYNGIDGKVHSYDFMFGIMFRLLASTGMRPGEVRAICTDQIKPNGIFINKMLDAYDILRTYLKKGNDDNLKQRTALLPTKMAELLDLYIAQRPKCDNDFIFTMYGQSHLA